LSGVGCGLLRSSRLAYCRYRFAQAESLAERGDQHPPPQSVGLLLGHVRGRAEPVVRPMVAILDQRPEYRHAVG